MYDNAFSFTQMTTITIRIPLYVLLSILGCSFILEQKRIST
jgi:hypothetical protein